MKLFLLILGLAYVNSESIRVPDELPTRNGSFVKSRRILGGHEVAETRPYMVYLRATAGSNPGIEETNWLCGGVIVHERYILTSAACIENAKQFYVVSGMHRWIPGGHQNECITNGAKKAVWKCVPKSYVYDGDQFDNIRWMIRDIAVVMVEDDFNFKRRVRGCDFIPTKIAYNNVSQELEKTGTHCSVVGWGSTESFSDDTPAGRAAQNSPELLEADVEIMSKKTCKKRWDSRYHHIIDEHMICVKDMGGDSMSLLCTTQEVNCTELVGMSIEDKEGDGDQETRRLMPDPSKMLVHTPGHAPNARKTMAGGGFCENDHGGPLVVGHGKTATVIGVVSACQTHDVSLKCHGPFLYTSVYNNRHDGVEPSNDHGGPLVVGHGKTATVIGVVSACQTHDVSLKCHGPFLYTSVYNNRHMINCAITKEMGTPTCRRLMRKSQVSETFFNWPKSPPQPKAQRLNSATETFVETTEKPTTRPPDTPKLQTQATTVAPPMKRIERHHY